MMSDAAANTNDSVFSKEACDNRHKELEKTMATRHTFNKWMLSIILGMMTLFVAGAGVSVFKGGVAHDKATSVEYKLEASKEVLSQQITSVKEDVTEIKEDMAKQTRMIEEIWRNGKHPKP